MTHLRSLLSRLRPGGYVTPIPGDSAGHLHLGPSGIKLRHNLRRHLLRATDNGRQIRAVTASQFSPSVEWLRERTAGLGGAKEGGMFNVVLGDDDAEENEVAEYALSAEDCKNEITMSSAGRSRFEMLTFLPKEEWKSSYQDLLRSRRVLWKRLLFDPWSVKVELSNAATETPSAEVFCAFRNQRLGFTDERGLKMEDIRMMRPDVVDERFPLSPAVHAEFRVVSTSSDLDLSSLSILMDSVRKRKFMDSTRLGKLLRLNQRALICNAKNHIFDAALLFKCNNLCLFVIT